MINSIYPYIIGLSAPSPKKIENSFRNLADGRVDAAAETGSDGESSALNPLTSLEGLQMNLSGFVASASLFTHVSDAGPGQSLPQMMLFQRGYEANLKVVRAEDEILKHTLDIIV